MYSSTSSASPSAHSFIAPLLPPPPHLDDATRKTLSHMSPNDSLFTTFAQHSDTTKASSAFKLHEAIKTLNSVEQERAKINRGYDKLVGEVEKWEKKNEKEQSGEDDLK